MPSLSCLSAHTHMRARARTQSSVSLLLNTYKIHTHARLIFPIIWIYSVSVYNFIAVLSLMLLFLPVFSLSYSFTLLSHFFLFSSSPRTTSIISCHVLPLPIHLQFSYMYSHVFSPPLHTLHFLLLPISSFLYFIPQPILCHSLPPTFSLPFL